MLACDKRRIVVMLRWALLIALCFLVIYGRGASIQAIASSVVLLLASNLVLMHLPDRIIAARLFDPVLVIVDTILITAGLWLCGAAGSDFFFLFFFVVFLSAIGERPELTALGAGLAAAGYLLLLYRGPVWNPAMLLRVPFLFATGLTYGFLVGKAREARSRASAAEHVLGTMSHEIRSPLSAIIRYSEALRTDHMSARAHGAAPGRRRARGAHGGRLRCGAEARDRSRRAARATRVTSLAGGAARQRHAAMSRRHISSSAPGRTAA